MAYKAIVAILALFAVASTSARTFKQAPVESTDDSVAPIHLELTLNLLIEFSPPDVRGALEDLVAAIKTRSEALDKLIKEAAAEISADAKTAFEKLDSFLANLAEKLQNAGDEIEADLKEQLTNAIEKVREFLAQQKEQLTQVLEQVGQQLNETAQQLKKDVAKVTDFIQGALKNISQAVNDKRVHLLSVIKNKLNDAITKLNDTLHSQEIQQAIQNALDNLKGRVVSIGDVLKEVGNQLAAAGQTVLAALVKVVATLLGSVLGLLSAVLGSVNLDLGVSIGA
jgi:phage-related protein